MRDVFLRCRAAAARCRQKRKIEIGNLEYKAEELQNSNSKLQVRAATAAHAHCRPVRGQDQWTRVTET